MQVVRRLVDARPTYGYRRITALANRERARTGEPVVSHKRVFRIMRQNSILPARDAGGATGRIRAGKFIVMRSNLRWCSDGFEIGCWNGDSSGSTHYIDAHDRERSHGMLSSDRVSGGMIRHMLLEAVESGSASSSRRRRNSDHMSSGLDLGRPGIEVSRRLTALIGGERH